MTKRSWLLVAGLAGAACGLAEATWLVQRQAALATGTTIAVVAWSALGYAAVSLTLATAWVAVTTARRGIANARPRTPAAPLAIGLWLGIAVAASLRVEALPYPTLVAFAASAALAVAVGWLLGRRWPSALDRVPIWAGAVVLLVTLSGTSLALRAAREAPTPESGAAGNPSRNVVLVTIDTLRADHLGTYGYAEGSTPVIDAIAEGGVVFEEAHAQSPFTCPSHASILTGLDPLEHGAFDNATAIRRDAPSLPETLRASGWETAAFVSSAPLRQSVCGLGDRFALYGEELSPWAWLPQETGSLHLVRLALPLLRRLGDFERYARPAEETTDAALAWLDGRGERRPFFLWIHYFDPHLPFSPPPPYDELFDPGYAGGADGHWYFIGTEARERISRSPQDLRHMIALYDGEIAYVDAQIGRLRDGLAERGLERSTLLVITADHGESHGEHRRYFARGLYRPSLNVPLILALPPGETPPARVASQVRLIDVAPTVLDWLGIAGADALPGASLLPLVRGEDAGERPAFAVFPATALRSSAGGMVSLQDRGYKLIRSGAWWYGDGVRVLPGEELYHVREDPGETRDVLEQTPPELPELRRQLRAWSQREAAVEAPSAEVQRMLEALGYAQ